MLPDDLPPVPILERSPRRVAVVTQAGIDLPVDTGDGREQRTFTIGDGEPAKRLATVEEL